MQRHSAISGENLKTRLRNQQFRGDIRRFLPKTSKLVLNLQQEKNFENLIIKVLKCKNSEFDDNPEVTAYIQVQDITLKNNDQVFIFNGWTFSSSPNLKPIDHPVYDLWLIGCENV